MINIQSPKSMPHPFSRSRPFALFNPRQKCVFSRQISARMEKSKTLKAHWQLSTAPLFTFEIVTFIRVTLRNAMRACLQNITDLMNLQQSRKNTFVLLYENRNREEKVTRWKKSTKCCRSQNCTCKFRGAMIQPFFSLEFEIRISLSSCFCLANRNQGRGHKFKPNLHLTT